MQECFDSMERKAFPRRKRPTPHRWEDGLRQMKHERDYRGSHATGTSGNPIPGNGWMHAVCSFEPYGVHGRDGTRSSRKNKLKLLVTKGRH